MPALLGATLNGLPSAVADTSATQAIRLADSVLGLVNSALADQLGTGPADPVAGQRALLLRMQAFAEEHLADADLSPPTSPPRCTSPSVTCTRCSAPRAPPRPAGSGPGGWSTAATT
ncbi:hypothetical protein ACFQ9X_15715 [Catenulispora yoronensis]